MNYLTILILNQAKMITAYITKEFLFWLNQYCPLQAQ